MQDAGIIIVTCIIIMHTCKVELYRLFFMIIIVAMAIYISCKTSVCITDYALQLQTAVH